ncbi:MULTISPECIES: group III truncated hemoglobin [Rhodococcus]|uniref:Group III truncated hemoglobin n=1 Tax=Rhodococcus indonesiensis TaxID=3055869 RepID=A0ABT7RLZ7_9NOCA|nr:group III truncated hemoglobin [Rhodococcus indonesiensis]MDM7488662.1 group III truncated hemoglobin [Rhodococcus indonesiensis]
MLRSPSAPTDLATRADIDRLLRRFYERALVDPVLEAPFSTLAVVGLDDHLPTIGDFWEQVLLRTGRYRGALVPVHAALHRQYGLDAARFDRWVRLWDEAVDELFAGTNADRAKAKAASIAAALSARLDRASSA